ncbi:MAG: SGNH/GDSL hydrolase family protein [Clostridia bacterium]|nr:SGNH/GDSL hydrolase family protein [Clostridia bacterium]
MDMTRYYLQNGEKPLDVLKPDGGLVKSLRSVACIGDSLSSGELESTNERGESGYHDFFEYSWGQFIARACGSRVYNFSRGGMTAKEMIDSWGNENDIWNKDKACQAYIFALGVNDLINIRQPLGTVDDIDFTYPEKSAETFAGYYGRVLLKFREVQPKGRFFLISMPKDYRDSETVLELKRGMRDLLGDIADKLEFTYVIDLFEYGPVYDEKFVKNFYLSGHLNVMGYQFTSEIVMSYIDWIMRKYPEDFLQTGFIGFHSHNLNAKW